MRRLTDAARLRQFMRQLGLRARNPGRVYLVGGACAVLLEWRDTTIDIDLDLDPSAEQLLREIPRLKEELQVNVELVSPAHFIPALAGWQVRSPFVTREGTLDFHYYDFYAQALSKIERGHDRDARDVQAMATQGLIEPARLLGFFAQIAPELYKYPALDPPTFRRAVEETVARLSRG